MTSVEQPNSGAGSNATSRQQLGELAPRLMRAGLAAGVVGLGITVLWSWLSPDIDAARFFRSYLFAFLFVLSLSLGAYFFVVLQHLAHVGWSVIVRRVAEGVAANLTWLWVLFLPIFLLMLFGGGDVLYHWADPHIVEEGHEHFDAVIAGKAGFLNKSFWLIRAAVYLAVWAILARFFLRTSIAQDSTGDVNLTLRMQKVAPIAMILYAFTQSFAIIDWAMSLEAHWFSTMYGVYFFAASCCGFFSLLLVAIVFLQRSGRVESEITLEHYQDCGKLLFAFGVVFWAYIAFSQYMLIWYANIPEETGWYLVRQLGGWRGVSALLLVGHFMIPFLLLVTKHTKRIKPVIASIAVWMLLMHLVDLYWLVMPHVSLEELAAANSIGTLRDAAAAGTLETGFHPHFIDLTAVLGMFGLFVAGTAFQLRQCSLVPVQDPRLEESLAFENL